MTLLLGKGYVHLAAALYSKARLSELALARREAAIVSPEEGTTRDLVEVSLDLAGYKVVLVDTAPTTTTS